MTAQPETSGSASITEETPEAPRISVIIPVHNAEDTIADQLEALARQDFADPWEVIVADNGSSDGSLAVARRFSDRLPLRCIDASQVRGVAHARNVAARVACAPLLAWVDADDEVAPGWLEAVVTALAEHTVVASRFDKERLNTPELQATRSLPQQHGLSQHNYAPFLPHVGGSGLAIRKSVHDAVGGFDETLLRLADTDYSWRVQLAGHAIHFEPSAVLHVRFRQGGGASFRQAYLYGRFNGRLYHRYRSHGMQRVPLWRDLHSIAAQLVHLPRSAKGAQREQRLRSLLNRIGILIGRIESLWLRP